jgi:hypothetical protein
MQQYYLDMSESIVGRLVRESLLAPTFAEIPSRGPLEPTECEMGILLGVGTR